MAGTTSSVHCKQCQTVPSLTYGQKYWRIYRIYS